MSEIMRDEVGLLYQLYQLTRRTQLTRPLFASAVCAGFPSLADDWIDYVESRVNDYLLLGVNNIGNSRRTSLFNSRGGGPAGVITVFLHTNRFSREPQHFGSNTTELAISTNSTVELLSYARRGAEEAFQEGFQYKKAGMFLNELVPAGSPSRSFWNPDERERELLRVVDKLNRKWGRDTVHFGRLATNGSWTTKAEKRSPRYTTQWEELLVI
jgi:hypothetical protein